MPAPGGSYRKERRKEAGRTADGLRKKVSSMFFGASPQQRKDLRQTEEPKKMKVDDMVDMNVVDRDKFNAPDKVGENVRLIDIAMGNAPHPAEAQRRRAEPPPPPPPEPTTRQRRRPAGRARASRAARSAAAASAKIVLQVHRGVTRHLERIAWVCAVLAAIAAFATLPLVASQAPERAELARVLYARGWEAAAQAPSLDAALAWSRELGLGLCALAVWSALFLRQWRAFRSPHALVELVRVLFLASLPTCVLGGLALWLGGVLKLPWAPPSQLTQLLTDLAARNPLPLPIAWLGAGVVTLASLLVAARRRRHRPLSELVASAS